MADSLIVSLRLVSSIVLLGFQLVVSQLSIDHRKVPQRIEQQKDTTENISAGSSGVWGSWGPWSACSRSCGGGVMEQTRPCLPANYHERSYQAPSHQYSGGEGASHKQNALGHETALNPYSGHVVSAIRTSVPLHRSGNNPAYSLPASSDLSHLGRGILRGNRKPLPQGQTPRIDRRNRTRTPISPGSYGYGKVPYILPLKSDTGQNVPRKKRQIQPGRPPVFEQNAGQTQYSNLPSTHFNNAYQEQHYSPLRPQPSLSHQSPYSPPLPSSQNVFPDASRQGSTSHSLLRDKPLGQRGATAITCTGAYKQYKLCNKQLCPGNNRGIREVQCASYNNKPFMGRLYEWEPFSEGELCATKELIEGLLPENCAHVNKPGKVCVTKEFIEGLLPENCGHDNKPGTPRKFGGNGLLKCELTCRAMGYRFYVRQAEKVSDGAPCDLNGTSICVAGQCKTIRGIQ